MDLDQLQYTALLTVDGVMRRLDEGGFAHAARAPQQGVVGGLATHTVLVTKDGTERPIDSGLCKGPYASRCKDFDGSQRDAS